MRKTDAVPAIARAMIQWFAREARDLPWRRTSDPYAIWVSEVMLQQTQVAAVIPYWERWLAALPTVRALAEAPLEQVLKLWEGLGYYSRARNLQRAAQLIQERYGGVFPQTRAEVLDLPGVGPYTAGAVCSLAFNQPEPILDGNIIRVLTRLFAWEGNPKAAPLQERLWAMARQLVATAAATRAHPRPCNALNQSLMELGALVCTPRNPRCAACPVQSFCLAKKQGRAEELPTPTAKAKITAREHVVFLFHQRGKYWVRQRPGEKVVNAGLWEFPSVELEVAGPAARHLAIQSALPTAAPVAELGKVTHHITRYRHVFAVCRADTAPSAAIQSAGGGWHSIAQIEALALAGAHRKIARRFLVDKPG